MAGTKRFINPLLQNSEAPEQGLEPIVPPKIALPEVTAKKRANAFEDTHIRFTSWVDKDLKSKFDALAAEKGVTKSALLNEAIQALLHKQDRKPYTKKHDSSSD